MFDDEVICLNPRKKEETARPVGRPTKYDNSISVNKFHDFNDLLEFDKWNNESTVNSTLSRQNQKPHEKDIVLKKKKKRNKAFLTGLWKLSRNSKSIPTSGFHCS